MMNKKCPGCGQHQWVVACPNCIRADADDRVAEAVDKFAEWLDEGDHGTWHDYFEDQAIRYHAIQVRKT